MNANKAKAKTDAPKTKDSDEDLPETKLVKMRREGQTLEVHPLLVDNHKKLGWSIE